MPCRARDGRRTVAPTRGKNPDPDVSAFSWREQKDRLGKVHLSPQALHLLRRDGTTVDEDAELISWQRLGGRNVTDEVRMQLGRSLPVGEPRDQWRRHRGSRSRACASLSTSSVVFMRMQYTDRYVYFGEVNGLP